MDSRECCREQYRVSRQANSTPEAKRVATGFQQGIDIDQGGGRVGSQKCSNQSTHTHRGLCECVVSSAQDRRCLAASAQPETAELFCGGSTLQVGVSEVGEGPGPARGLVSQTGPQGCISHCPHSPASPGVPQVRVAGGIVAVQGAPVRPELCPLHLHKTHETSGVLPQTAGNQTRPLLRRHAPHGPIQGTTPTPLGVGPEVVRVSGVHCEHQEEHVIPNKEAGIPGVPRRLHRDENLPSEGQGTFNHTDGEEHDGGRDGEFEKPCQSNRHDGGGTPGHPSSTPALPLSGEGEIPGAETWPPISCSDTGHPGNEGGPQLVDCQDQPAQWEDHEHSPVGSCDRVRCLQDGLGSVLPRYLDGGSMDKRRAAAPHQLPGAACSIPGPPDICDIQETNCSSSPSRQCNRNCLHEQDGGSPLGEAVQAGGENMELVPHKGYTHTRGTPPRERECSSGLGVSPHFRLQRLEARQRRVQTAGTPARPLLSGPICVQDEPSTSSLLQLEARPEGMGSGCPVNPVGTDESLHVPPIYPHSTVPQQAGDGQGVRLVNCSSMAQPSVVSSTAEVPDGCSSALATYAGHTHGPNGSSPSTSSEGPPTLGRVACVRRDLQARGFSEGVVTIIRQSWRGATEASYSSAWRMWVGWCCGRGTDPISAPLSEILEFLLVQFQAGKQYRTINSFRSAISMTHNDIDGTRVGQHPIVTRFLRGVFNSRPPTPRYGGTWDTDTVLRYLEGVPANPDLTLQQLTQKLAMLLALANADRCSDLAALDVSRCYHQENGVRFVITALTKTRRRGPPLEVFYPSFPDKPALCPVEALKEYEKRTAPFRPGAFDPSPLFLAVRKPHKPVKPATIGRWLKTVMSQAGIDTSIFTAHSTRGAATSKAKTLGVSLADILKAASWSSSSTFTRFYHRPIHGQHFGRSVLRGSTQCASGEL